MSLKPELHKRLLARQPTAELRRKMYKALSLSVITQEENDFWERWLSLRPEMYKTIRQELARIASHNA